MVGGGKNKADSLDEVTSKSGGRDGRVGPAGFMLRSCGVAAILAGIVAAGSGDAWAPQVFGWLPAGALGIVIEIFVPFLPIALVGLGAFGVIKSRG